MALIPCRECGEMISDKAVSCPKCGYPMESSQNENETVCEESEKNNESKEEKPKITKKEVIEFCIVLGILFIVALWAIITTIVGMKEREQSTIKAMKGISKDLGEITEQYNKEVDSIMEDIKRDEAERKSK